MKRLFTSLTLLVFCFNAMSQTGVFVPQMVAFDAAMNNLMTTHGLPGGQLAITYQGRLVYSRGFGYADVANQLPVQPESIFRIASISKPVTAIAVMKLFEQGLINLDAKVFGPTGILNDAIYQTILDPQVTDITVRNLLQHSGGWDRNISGDPMFNSYAIATAMGATPPASPVVVIQYILANEMLDFAPGTQAQYSNIGYCILGRVIEKITGQNYDDYVTSAILNPAGVINMHIAFNLLANQLPDEVQYYDYAGAPLANSVYNNTTLVPWPYGGFNLEGMDANGGWVTSAADLCRLLVAVDRFPTKPDILLPATIDTMIKPSVQDPYYACGFGVNTFNNWWHTGGLPGTATEFVRAGNQQLNWAMTFNTRALNSNAMYTDIDNLVWNNLASVSSWPTHDLFTSINENKNAATFNIYPNPASQSTAINFTDGRTINGDLKIIDVMGKEINSFLVSASNFKLETSHLPEGIYFIRIKSGNSTAVSKLIVQHF